MHVYACCPLSPEKVGRIRVFPREKLRFRLFRKNRTAKYKNRDAYSVIIIYTMHNNQHPADYVYNQNGELAHQADCIHNPRVAKARSDSDHPQRGALCGPSCGMLIIQRLRDHVRSQNGEPAHQADFRICSDTNIESKRRIHPDSPKSILHKYTFVYLPVTSFCSPNPLK